MAKSGYRIFKTWLCTAWPAAWPAARTAACRALCAAFHNISAPVRSNSCAFMMRVPVLIFILLFAISLWLVILIVSNTSILRLVHRQVLSSWGKNELGDMVSLYPSCLNCSLVSRKFWCWWKSFISLFFRTESRFVVILNMRSKNPLVTIVKLTHSTWAL